MSKKTSANNNNNSSSTNANTNSNSNNNNNFNLVGGGGAASCAPQRGSLSLNVGSTLSRSFSRSSFMMRAKLSSTSSSNSGANGKNHTMIEAIRICPWMFLVGYDFQMLDEDYHILCLKSELKKTLKIPFSPHDLFILSLRDSTALLKLHSDRGDSNSPNGLADPLLSNPLLEGYSEEELSEYRQVFNMFDADRSGAIAIDELEAAIKNLGLEQTRDELDKIIDEVDQRGNHQIDFDEFCVVMRRLTMKKSTWNEVIKECFTVFDRSENGGITKKDFRYILRELGDITDNQIIDEIFNEADVDGNGVIDYDEFTYMVKNYMTDDDIA
ncbi:unnamed protein product [Caenorhabditis angaria]|uniref:EF-hand domain-containing protein n=1 Tax=Caenorhabditis angaria TaxID=860376 RepID=A0A9P1IYP8_9PELO|nr:unnamed protein product [Caenorhabditis angaria]